MKRWIFFGLCLVYTAAMLLLNRFIDGLSHEYAETINTQMKYAVGGSLLFTWIFYALQQLLTGRAAVEYVIVMPFLILISSFLIGAVLGIFGVMLFDTPYAQACLLHLVFSLLVAARMWRRFWITAPAKPVDGSVY